MIKYYLGEEPILNNAPTYMPMFEADRKEVLNRMGELVIKDVAEAGGYGVVFGRRWMPPHVRSSPTGSRRSRVDSLPKR